MSEPNNQSPFARLTRSSVHNNKITNKRPKMAYVQQRCQFAVVRVHLTQRVCRQGNAHIILPCALACFVAT